MMNRLCIIVTVVVAATACGGSTEMAAPSPTTPPATTVEAMASVAAASLTTTGAPVTTTVALIATATPSTTTVVSTTTTSSPSVTTIVELVPEALGAILSSEPVDIGHLGVAWRITYRSRSISGEPIEVTGVIAAPAGEATAPRPVLSVAHGTTGMADQCAPSLGFPGNFINSGMAKLLERGWVVTATDYEGMGGLGIHPYVVGESEARGVFDIVRAAQTMPVLGADGPLIVWGHSQGGHAAMHAAARWRALAPELDLVGVAAGAPPSQFSLLSAFLKGSDYQGYLVMAAAAMAATYPELDLSTVVRPEHLGLISELENGCIEHIFEIFNGITYSDLIGVEDIFSIPEWHARLNENDTNQLPNQVPVIILHGELDSQIPVVSSALLLGQLCAFTDHASLERRVYEGKDHGTVVPAYWDDLLAWMDARVAGEPAIDQCG